MSLGKDDIARALGISPAKQRELESCSNYPSYDCRCGACRRWWQSVGPESGGAHAYGPFVISEIEDDSEFGQHCKTLRLALIAEGQASKDGPTR